MRALLYVTKRSIVNQVKQAKKKPLTFILGIFLIAYFVFLAGIGIVALVEADFPSSYALVAALTLWIFYSFFSNFAAYAKRKGIIFRPSHAHFIFTAPIHPKIILLYGAGYNFLLNFIVSVGFAVVGIIGFHIHAGTAVLLFFVSFIMESVLEGSIIIFLYANEWLSERAVKLLAWSIYLLLAGVTLFGVWYFRTKGFSLESVIQLVDFPGLQMLPIAGWNIAMIRLILLGPTTLNLICSGLYAVAVILMALVAYKMKCNGGYYEEAAKFADDYAEMKSRKNNGEMVLSIGSKKKFKKASIEYKASGAKAIFYRQLLEYKKEKWFIFSYMTAFCIVADIIIIKFVGIPEATSAEIRSLYLLGVALYLALLTGGYLGKWEKELKNPYLYLLPDSPAKKMWYATLMEHVKAIIDGVILVLPIGIVWEIGIFPMLCIWLIYIVLQAIKLYAKVLIDSLLGNARGITAKQLLRMGIQGGIVGIGAVFGALSAVLVNVNMMFLIVLAYSVVMAVVIGLLTVSRFAVMEQLD